ncbi:UDP-3-O-(3-hydroxymyristoyl)glucosamine N-acyltransferase [Brumimicrobium salinarum]|uniref:UDP-3-O-(3-hydroxymyristoyl)glucosamine N-acyltransferase n=1 Tax=Brumimicrobium salinarum TaxID=2058658 RepID=A0A2I0R481_9FLAO|nr:LpxD N-terminal domain-containing protein [Brumimicrobium salinarum]PKR81392.1 UDP-3-O-(3-hydroxymyristoyl)glucosamine N-acyltransferase [Brumimicrobium salinarum]
MRLKEAKTLEQLATLLKCDYVGEALHKITGLNEIHRVEAGDLVFVDHPKYYDKALNSKATTILIDKKVECPAGKGLLISENPFDDFNKLTKLYKPTTFLTQAIGENTTIDSSARIFPNVTIGNNVKIGKNAVIYPGVVIMDDTVIENNVLIGANTVIGQHAFYYKKKDYGYERLHSSGKVLIKNNVEIGALCTIDAGVTATTIIGEGTKIDNQVQIGHDTIIGKNCLFAANVGIAGCVDIKDNVTMWGQVGCASDVVIGENVVVLAKSGISKSLAANKTYFGSPAKDIRLVYREMAALRKLPEVLESL